MNERHETLRVGIVGGAGWLGGALATALVDSGVVRPQDLCLSYRSERPDRFEASVWTRDNQALADCSDVVVLSVRPQDWEGLCLDLGGKLVISVMAGIRIEAIARRHGTLRVVRSLPNAAVEVRRSYTPWFAAASLSPRDRDTVRSIFDACGTHDEIAREDDLDFFTGMTGSGPAFPALLASAMIDAAVAHGIDRAIAARGARAVLVGAGHLLERTEADPAETVQTFLDYQGTTAAALAAMQASGFKAAIGKGLTAASLKSAGLGKSP